MPRIIIIIFLLTPIWLLGQNRAYKLSSHVQSSDYAQNRIAVKFKRGFSPSSLKTLSFKLVGQSDPFVPVKKTNPNQRSTSIMDGVYYLNLSPGQDPLTVCNSLLKNDEIEYAEVLFYEQLFHSPNDPFANQTTGNQDYLQTIKAYEAWDITTGDPSVLIGIVDTGMDIDHADLMNNYFQNFGDVVDGVDNDVNGYFDDFMGYDFADDDNDPNADTHVNSSLNHGTHVGGIAGATTNNNLGIAGVAYNCSIVPLKGFTTAAVLSTGVWEGVMYAADNGYDIVNLSWGNTNGFSQFYQDIIDYCVLEKDMVVIAAAGNTNADLDFYPASYEYVISVGASTLSDTKWSSGTYGDHVDIMAPGVSIFSTQKDDTYGSDNGSSHATPMVAGAAGLVKSVFQMYNARQIMEQLRVTSDDIYSVSGNESYIYQLGKGRLNVERAVTETDTKSIRVQNFTLDNGYGPYAFYGDTLTLEFDLINYLSKVDAPIISIQSDSPYLILLDEYLEPGIMQPMESIEEIKYRIVLEESTPSETEIRLRFFMEDGAYQDFQNFSFITSPDHLIAASPNLGLTVAGNGDIGLTEDYDEGVGFTYQDETFGNYHGLLMGDSETRLYDNVPSTFIPEANDGDFIGTKPIKFYEHSDVGSYVYSEFKTWDDDFLVEQVVIPGKTNDFILIEYRIVNKSGENLTDFHLGLYSNQNLPEGANNVTWDASDASFIFADEIENIVGALAMADASSDYVALNMKDFNSHSQDIGNTFSNTEKFNLLDGPNVSFAGEMPGGNDVAGIVKTTFATFPNNTEIKIGFILSASETTGELSANIAAARNVYADFTNNPEVYETFFSCEGGAVTVDPQGGNFDFYEDPLGSIFIANGTSILVNNISNDTAIFAQNLDLGYPSRLTKIAIEVLDQVASFQSSVDTLYLDSPTLNLIQFQDESYQPISWLWDFDNGQQSTVQNPSMNFQSIGTYNITLNVESALGCSDQYTHQIIVANRPSTPTLDDFEICIGESIVLTHSTDEYALFDSSGDRILNGSILNIGPFEEDSILLIANRINQFESLPQAVQVSIDPIAASFEFYPDTLSTETSALIRYTGSNATTYDWKIDGNQVSTAGEFTHLISGDLNLDLTVSNDNCEDVISESISFLASQVPSQNDIQACAGELLIIKPTNGTYFGFYSDQNLEQLLHKGTRLILDNPTQNTAIYVIGLDNILPSSSKMVSIEVAEFETSIIANPPLLDLTLGSHVQFSAGGIASAKWYLNDQLIETALSPILFFNEAGLFEIRLEAISNEGCNAVSSMTYEVKGLALGIVDNNFKIYPNPTYNEIFHIESAEMITSISVLNISGKLIPYEVEINDNTFKIDLAAGMYFLEISTPAHTALKRVIIK